MIYHDGVLFASTFVLWPGDFNPPSGRIVLGRNYVGVDSNYGSSLIDEVYFFNHTLSRQEISMLIS